MTAAWVPDACTLPTVGQPTRVAEFDALFAEDLLSARRTSPTSLEVRLDAAAEERVRDLTARESDCCSFFTFTIEPDSDAVVLAVSVPSAHRPVLDALERRALGL